MLWSGTALLLIGERVSRDRKIDEKEGDEAGSKPVTSRSRGVHFTTVPQLLPYHATTWIVSQMEWKGINSPPSHRFAVHVQVQFSDGNVAIFGGGDGAPDLAVVEGDWHLQEGCNVGLRGLAKWERTGKESNRRFRSMIFSTEQNTFSIVPIFTILGWKIFRQAKI